MFVREWMTSNPPIATSATQVRRACDLMAKNGLHLLPVVDPGRRLLGVVTHRVLHAAVVDAFEDLGDPPLRLFLDRTAPTLAPEARVEDALSVFDADPRLDALPVVEQGRLRGVLTRMQAMRAAARRGNRDAHGPLFPYRPLRDPEEALRQPRPPGTLDGCAPPDPCTYIA